MKVSIALGALTAYPLSMAFSLASRTASDGVEILLSDRLIRRGPEAIGELARRHQVPVLSVHEPLRWRKRSIEDALDDAAATVEFASRIESCRAAVLHYPTTTGAERIQLGTWLRGLADVRSRYRRSGLAITIENRAENHDGVGHQPLDDPAILKSVLAEWDIGLTLDVAHAAAMKVDPVELIDAIPDRVQNVHLSDVKERRFRGGLLNGLFRDHQPLGAGSAPVRETIEALARNGYQDLLTLEFNPWTARAWCPPLALSMLRASVHKARNDVGVARYLHVVSESGHHRHAR